MVLREVLYYLSLLLHSRSIFYRSRMSVNKTFLWVYITKCLQFFSHFPCIFLYYYVILLLRSEATAVLQQFFYSFYNFCSTCSICSICSCCLIFFNPKTRLIKNNTIKSGINNAKEPSKSARTSFSCI